MYELAKVTLENEMDLVLAHKRSMKLAEIAGLTLSAQTTFATAVSEIARNTIDNGKNGCLTLGISDEKRRSIVACITDDNLRDLKNKDGLDYAKRLVDKLNVFTQDNDNTIELYQYVPQGNKIDIQVLDQWRINFRNEPPISPYDEIKRKSEQLKELTEKLRDSEDHYRMLTDTLPLMMFSINETGGLTYVNKWMTDYFGLSLEDFNASLTEDLIYEEDRPDAEELAAMTNSKTAIKAEWRLRNASGNYLWHMVSINPIITDNKASAWFGFLVDINAQKLFEQTLKDNQELKKAQQLLQYNITELNRSNEELQQFAFVASHDLQEPLRKVTFYSDYLQMQEALLVDDKSIRFLHGIRQASDRMRGLITDLLGFSQVNKRKMDLKHLSLNHVMQDAVSDFELIIKEKNATVEIRNLPELQGDETMLRRLFENLLSNSLKYVREDVAPVITINAKQEGDVVKIEFTDNGIGFDEQYLSKIFTLFQRLHDKQQFSGSGLGLAICRKIVEMHNGSITATSKVNVGSCFLVRLPVKQE